MSGGSVVMMVVEVMVMSMSIHKQRAMVVVQLLVQLMAGIDLVIDLGALLGQLSDHLLRARARLAQHAPEATGEYGVVRHELQAK